MRWDYQLSFLALVSGNANLIREPEMTQSIHTKCRNTVLGALVADAAAMGLHWIYNQEHISKIAPETPEFKDPDPRNYDGIPAYYAHPTKTSGELSQYGEQVMVMLRTLVQQEGQFCAAGFAEQFRTHFGYGGAYVGYIDHATRGTLDNYRKFEDAVNARAADVPFKGEQKIRKTLIARLLPLLDRHKGQALADAFKSSVHEISPDKATIEFADRLLDAVKEIPRATGTNDVQLPAIAKLPALVAVLCAQGNSNGPAFSNPIAAAIKSTSDTPIAANFGMAGAQMMANAITQNPATNIIEGACAAATPEVCELLEQALEMKENDNVSVTKHFGMACDMPYGIPSAAHNIATARSFSDAIRRNIYGGGDSCGRAILVGSVMGATFGIAGEKGIPQEWLDRLAVKEEAQSLLDQLFA